MQPKDEVFLRDIRLYTQLCLYIMHVHASVLAVHLSVFVLATQAIQFFEKFKGF